MARLCPLFSGSRGNSVYVGSQKSGILIDAGRSAKQIEKSLFNNGIDVNSIKAIFVTHEHSDHISGIRVLASRYNIRVLASSGTMSAMERLGAINGKFPSEIIAAEGTEIAGFFVKPFKTPHDSTESTGYIVKIGDKQAVIATDIGYMSDVVKGSIAGSDVVVIESNHDVKMLQNGAYPYFLKKRILSDTGHLSNTVCAESLPSFVKNKSTRFVLAHLSEENNMPNLAYQTAFCRLSLHKMKQGLDFTLDVAPVENLGQVNVVF